mgnify:CR=1 FL=1
MVLFAIFGELGTGKTLSAVSLTFRNWIKKRTKVYSNIPLYKIPYHLIDSLDKLDMMRDGVVLADEMWTLLNARRSTSKTNRLVSSILLKSRKRDLVYFFTSQLLDLIDKTVRRIIDFSAYPVLVGGEPPIVCKLYVFKGTRQDPRALFRTLYYKTPLVFQMYDTRYEVVDIVENENDGKWKIIFQEDPNKEPIYFETWEEADRYAYNWWLEKLREKDDYIEEFPWDDILESLLPLVRR